MKPFPFLSPPSPIIQSPVNLVNSPHRHLHHRKRARTHGHSPQQRRANSLPEPSHALRPERLPKTIPHILIFLGGTKPVSLHLTLDHIQRITAQPQSFSRQTTVQRNFVARDLLPVNFVPCGIGVHKPLERQEPETVGLRLAQDCHDLTTVKTGQDAACLLAEFPHTIPWSAVQTTGAVRLSLKTDTDVLNRTGDNRVGNARKGASGVVLAVTEGGNSRDEGFVGLGTALLEEAAGGVESAELDGDAGADAQEGSQSALVKGEGAFVFVDAGCGGKGGGVLG